MDERRMSREAGFALASVIFTLVVVSVVAAAAVQLSLDDRRATWAWAEGERAHAAAQAGAHRVWAAWPAAADALAPGDSVDLGWTVLPDRSRYRAVISRVDGGALQQLHVLRVEGRSAGPRGGQRVVELWSTRGADLFTRAVGARWDLLISNDALVDSYNSGAGAYGGTNVGSHGHIHSNAQVTIANNSTVAGAASASGAVITSTGGVATEGTSNAVQTETFPAVDCPGGGFTPASALPPGGYSYDETTGNLTIDNTTLQLPAGVYNFNDVQVRGSGGVLEVPAGSHVDIHVAGTFTMGQQARLNDGGSPLDLTLYGCGATTELWSLNQNSLAWAAIYAPFDDVVIQNDSDLFGAVVGRNVTIWQGGSGPVSVHFDELLTSSPAGGGRRQLVRPWAQITR